MNTGDSFRVWETKALRRSGEGEAKRMMLDRIAKQVQPIMRNHKWKVKLLSEMHSKNALGSNLGAGVHIKLQLRKLNRDQESLPFHEVLDTMLHELCHNDIAPHDAKFYKLWEELREECDELRSKGITGVGSFDRPGRVLGGVSPQPPLSSLPQTALAAAEKRAHSNSLLPSGPKLLGGDRFVMYDLSPVQAAAMAVEKRLQYDLWCASQDLVDMGQNIGHSKIICGPITNALDTISRKRNRASNISSESNSVDLEAGDASTNDRVWTCKFWTLENCVKLDKCSRVSK
ncbi:zinc ion binding [Citrus sinensis]|uniref:Zinc ion binding n=1 Tax=Citrus sinensis TaxID=2711 RepID=A0ACB8P221_CITSI|nr:zinc ion binding [Citrus sinensis]